MKFWAQITDFVILNDHFFKKKNSNLAFNKMHS